MTGTKMTILLTGASGVLGRALIAELAGDFDLVCLRHRRPLGDTRVRELAGDLVRDDLGIDPAQRRELGRRVAAVVHCGAVTDWNASNDEVHVTNARGTEHVLSFARRANVPLYHMSTAFVARAGARAGQPDGTGDGPAAYVASKVAAERMVRDSAVPAVILRPSLVSGDSRDGRIASFQGLHRMVGFMLRDSLPVIPVSAETLIDAVPQDTVARAVRRLLHAQVTDGDYWLTAGQDALSVTDMVETVRTVAEDLGVRIHPPRLISREATDRLLLPLMEDVIPVRLRLQFGKVLEFLRLFDGAAAFPTSLAELGLDAEVRRQPLLTAFRRSAEYWAARHGLAGRAEARAADAPARVAEAVV